MTTVYQCDFCDGYKTWEEMINEVKIKGTNRRGNTATIYTTSHNYKEKNPLLDILTDDEQHICGDCVSNLTWEVTCD